MNQKSICTCLAYKHTLLIFLVPISREPGLEATIIRLPQARLQGLSNPQSDSPNRDSIEALSPSPAKMHSMQALSFL